MVDGSKKRKRQLAFELQSSRVLEKRSKPLNMMQDFRCCFILALFLIMFCLKSPSPTLKCKYIDLP